MTYTCTVKRKSFKSIKIKKANAEKSMFNKDHQSQSRGGSLWNPQTFLAAAFSMYRYYIQILENDIRFNYTFPI